jgi:hypothetical protein
MEIQSILIFALLGAVAMLIVAGGVTSMMDEDATPMTLASGASVGAAMGAAFAHFSGSTDALEMPKQFMDVLGAGAAPAMKVGLPNF